MKKLLILCAAVLTVGIQQVSATPYQKSFYFGQSDQHTYSVTESVTTTGNIVTAGSVYRSNGQPGGNVNIHLQEVTPTGVVVWSNVIIGSVNEYCMNINKISGGYILTGYQQTITGQKRATVWIVNTVGNLLQQRTYTHPTLTTHSTYALHGFQASDGRYIVSGFVTASESSASAKQGMVLKLGATLTVTWARFLNTPNGTGADHDMCEFGIETPNGYFITGSENVSSANVRQGVLAVWLNPATGAIAANRSFTNGNSRECGASASYNAASNKLYLLYNNSIIHSFAIAEFTGTTFTTNTNYATPNFNNYQGFSIRISQSNANELIVAGMTQSYTISSSQTNNSTPFLVKINRTTFAVLGDINFLIPSNGFNSFGGFFKYFDGQQPYIFTPEIMAWSTTGTEISLLGYRKEGGADKFRLEIINNIYPGTGDLQGTCGYNQLSFTSSATTFTTLATPATTTTVSNQASVTTAYRVNPSILDCNRIPDNCGGQAANAGPDNFCPPAQIGTPAIAGCTYTWSGTGTLNNYNIAQPFTSNTGGTFLLTMINACGEVSFDIVVVSSSSQACREANPNTTTISSITLYPNPASESVTLEWSVSPETTSEIRIVDVTGRQVITQTVNSAYTNLDVSALPQGLYICQFTVNGETVKTERLVINH